MSQQSNNFGNLPNVVADSRLHHPAFSDIKKLVSGYPSHEFVIDYSEAKLLFKNVRTPTSDEFEMENLLRGFNCVPHQDSREMILCLSKNQEPVEKKPENDIAKTNIAVPENEATGNGHEASPSGTATAKAEQKPASRSHSRALTRN